MTNDRLKRSRFAIAAVALAGTAVFSSAQAADLPVKAPAFKRIYNWTGCYIGGYGGWATANSWKSTDSSGYNPGAANPWDFSLNSSALYGGTLGCNWQASPWFVLGVEGEGGHLGASGPSIQPGVGAVRNFSKTSDGYGLIAGRFGVVIPGIDRLLLYGKVGVAFYDTSSTITDGNTPGFSATGNASQSVLAVGGGFEYAIFEHWMAKAEYMMFESGASYNACGATGGGTACWKQDPSNIHTVKFGLNYKF